MANVINSGLRARWGVNFALPRFMAAAKMHDCEAGAGCRGTQEALLSLSTESWPGESRVKFT